MEVTTGLPKGPILFAIDITEVYEFVESGVPGGASALVRRWYDVTWLAVRKDVGLLVVRTLKVERTVGQRHSKYRRQRRSSSTGNGNTGRRGPNEYEWGGPAGGILSSLVKR